MSRRPAAITEADVKRVIRAAQATLGDRARVSVVIGGATVIIEQGEPLEPKDRPLVMGLGIVP